MQLRTTKPQLRVPSTRQEPTQSNEAGYTLTEILVVLFCLSLLIGLSIPSYHTVMGAKSVRSTVHQLYGDVRLAQSLSLQQRIPYYLRFNPDGYEVWDATNKRKEVTFPPGIRIQVGKIGLSQSEIRFNGKGHPAGGGSIEISDRFGHSATLVVHLHTGQVDIREGGQ